MDGLLDVAFTTLGGRSAADGGGAAFFTVASRIDITTPPPLT